MVVVVVGGVDGELAGGGYDGEGTEDGAEDADDFGFVAFFVGGLDEGDWWWLRWWRRW